MLAFKTAVWNAFEPAFCETISPDKSTTLGSADISSIYTALCSADSATYSATSAQAESEANFTALVEPIFSAKHSTAETADQESNSSTIVVTIITTAHEPLPSTKKATNFATNQPANSPAYQNSLATTFWRAHISAREESFHSASSQSHIATIAPALISAVAPTFDSSEHVFEQLAD